MSYVSGSVRQWLEPISLASRCSRLCQGKKRTEVLVRNLAERVVGFLGSLDHLDALDHRGNLAQFLVRLDRRLARDPRRALEQVPGIAPAVLGHRGLERRVRTELEEDLEDVGQELLGPEAVLFGLFDFEFLTPRAGEDVQVLIEHRGETVDNLGREERLLRLVREQLEQTERFVSEVEIALDRRLVLPEELLLLLPLSCGQSLPCRLVVHRTLHVGDLAEVH